MVEKKGIINLKELKRKISALSAEEFSEFRVSLEKIEATRQQKQNVRFGKSSSRCTSEIGSSYASRKILD